jgi:hypothetical protein
VLIKPLKCPQCGKEGRPGELNFQISKTTPSRMFIRCSCGHDYTVPADRDQLMLSSNLFVRLGAASNHLEQGIVEITVGRSATITFTRPFDFPSRVLMTPAAELRDGFVYARELYLQKTKMEVLTSSREPRPLDGEKARLAYIVYGLVDISQLPNWYILFYSGITNHQNGFYKAALMDYAISFEVFLESFLQDRLLKKYDQTVASYMLGKTWRIEERCKDLLELVTGHRLSECTEVYQPWDLDVRQPRNDLTHGKKIGVDQAESERAHQAVYQAVRWIEKLS